MAYRKLAKELLKADSCGPALGPDFGVKVSIGGRLLDWLVETTYNAPKEINLTGGQSRCFTVYES